MSEPIEAARAAVQRSDKKQGWPDPMPGEVSALRDALRALIQWAEDMEQQMNGLRRDLSNVRRAADRVRQRTGIT